MTRSSPALLATEHLSVSIGGVEIVEGLDLELRAGQSLGVLGPNGIGKTTLLLTLAGVRVPDSGVVRLDGIDLAAMARRDVARRLGMLTQNTRFAFDASCLEVALSGRHPHLAPLARESEADRRLALDALAAVDLAGRQRRSCERLSGGEARRLALATLLTQEPAIALLDEPTNHLDPAHAIAVLDLLWTRLHEQPRAQVMAIHDINLVTCYCSDVLLLMGAGRWELGPTRELLTESRLSALFGCPIRAVHDGRQTVFAIAGART